MPVLRPHHGGNLAWAAALADCLPQEILDFSASINPLGPPDAVVTAITQHLSQIRAYPDPTVTPLRQQLSQIHQVPIDWILVGNGVAELLTWAGRSLSELDQTHVLTPAFSDYGRALGAFQANVRHHLIPLERSSDVGSRLWTEFEQIPTHVTLGLLLNNPHNPTGQVFEKTTLLPLLARSQRVVVDEAFMDFVPDAIPYSLIPAVERHPNLVILRSLTKFYSIPGLRLGYAIGHPDLLQQWQTWRDPWSVNALAIVAGMAALQDAEFQAQTHRWLAAAQPIFVQGLTQIPGLYPLPSAVNFVLVRCDGSVTQLQAELLKQHRILIRDCLSFAELGDRYFRVAVRTESENARLLQALSNILG